MAFCTKCGKELAENEVCTCQQEAPVEAPQAEVPVEASVEAPQAEVPVEAPMEAPVEAPQAEATQSPVDQVIAAVKKLDKKVLYGAAGVVALLFIVLIVSLAGGKPYKKMLKEYVSVVNKKSTNADAYEYALMADGRVKLNKAVTKAYMKFDGAEDALEEATEELSDMFENLDDEYGKWKYSYEIKSAEKIEKDDLEDYQKDAKKYYREYIKPNVKSIEKTLEDDDKIEDFADENDISEKEAIKYYKARLKRYKDLEDMKITAGYEVKVKFYAKTEDDEYKSDLVKVIFLKANGDWVYAGPEKGYFGFEKDDISVFLNLLNSSYLYR